MICYNNSESIEPVNEHYTNQRKVNRTRHKQNTQRKIRNLKRQIILMNIKLLKCAIAMLVNKQNRLQIKSIKSNKRNLERQLEDLRKESR